MKSAIYIEDGLLQFVLTPETEIDRKVLDALESSDGLQTFRGEFYGCQGGWTRWSRGASGFETASERSLIFKVTKKAIDA